MDDKVLAAFNNYTGAIAANRDAGTVAVSSPQGNALAVLDAATGKVVSIQALTEVCGLAPDRGGFMATTGRGQVIVAGGRGTTGPAIALVTPDMGFPYRTDRAALNELDGALEVAEGMGIGAMLGRYLVLRGQLRHHARLPDRMGERLFTVDVFPRP